MFDENRLSPTAQAVILICLLGMLMLSLGVIFLPSYLEFMANRQQREAVSNLEAVYRAEQSFFDKNRRYADSFAELGYAPTGMYTYYLGREMEGSADGQVYPLPDNVRTWANSKDFQAVAVANLDEDEDLDTWIVNEKGNIIHVFNDFDRPRLRDYPKALKRMLTKKKPGGNK